MSRQLNIVMLIDTWFPFYGGGQVHVRELRKKLQEDYFCQVELFYSTSANLLLRFLWSFLVVIQIIIYSRHHPIDIIHSHGFIAGLPARIIATILKIPVVHTVHGSHLMDQQAKTPKAWLEKWLLTKIPYDLEITVASTFLQYDNVNHHIQVISNGVNISEFNQVKVKKNQLPTIIWVGRDHPDKGVNYLKEAILKVRKKISQVQVELVTGGRLVGRELIKAYKKAHVFALASLAEGQPITLLEAWAAKLPVVVTRVGDNPKMVKDNVNGILVDPGNSQQLAKAILKILRSKTKATAMGIAGYNEVKRQYTWDKIARKTYTAYQSLLK